jgi:hypothetical protein
MEEEAQKKAEVREMAKNAVTSKQLMMDLEKEKESHAETMS